MRGYFMKRVLHISKYYYPFIGGIEQVARDCVLALKDEYEQKVICFNHVKGNKVDKIDDVEITRVHCQMKVASQSIALSYKKQLKRIIKEFNPDIVIFHYPNPFVAHSLLKFRKKKTFKLYLYWHLDITKQKILGKLFHGQNKRLIKAADQILGATPIHIEKSRYYEYFKDKSTVLPYAINQDRLNISKEEIERSKQIKKENEGKTICFAIGRHVPYKGMEYLIRASKLLDDKYRIYIGGEGPLTESLKELAKDDSKVEFLGKIDDSTWRSYLNACDIFCFPSITKNECFGLALAEAMYYKKPVITFNIECSGVNYVSIKGVTGIECENSNYEQFADAIMELAENKDVSKTFGEAGYERVISNFTFDNFENNLKKVL